MSQQTTIEWTHATWNPATGCTEVSPGCDHCYARTLAERFRGVVGHPYEQGFEVKRWSQRLAWPCAWKKPRRILVNSMSDLFSQDVPDDFIVEVFHTMVARPPQHTHQVLTKRPLRLLHTSLLKKILAACAQWTRLTATWPGNVWLGVSVESAAYTWRIRALPQLSVAPRFISAEPLLGPLVLDLCGIDWLIAGAESGRGARPMSEDWVRSLRDQCLAAGIAFFYKQNALNGRKLPTPALDGVRWTQFPPRRCLPIPTTEQEARA